MKSPIFPADGSSPCVVIPKIVAVIKNGERGVIAKTSHEYDSDGYILGEYYEYPDTQSRDEAYNRLIEAIKEWYE